MIVFIYITIYSSLSHQFIMIVFVYVVYKYIYIYIYTHTQSGKIPLSGLSSPINITFFFSCMKHKFFTVLLSSLIILSFQLLLSSHKKKKQSLTIVKLGNLRWKSPGYEWPNKIEKFYIWTGH